MSSLLPSDLLTVTDESLEKAGEADCVANTTTYYASQTDFTPINWKYSNEVICEVTSKKFIIFRMWIISSVQTRQTILLTTVQYNCTYYSTVEYNCIYNGTNMWIGNLWHKKWTLPFLPGN